MSWIDRDAAARALASKHQIPRGEAKAAINVGIARGEIDISTFGRLSAEDIARLRITTKEDKP